MSGIDHTHDPAAQSWVDGAADHADFPVQNLPLGVFSPPGGEARIGCAIGDFILDLAAASSGGLLPASLTSALAEPRLNSLFALASAERTALRLAVFDLLTSQDRRAVVAPLLHSADSCNLHLPARIGDYTDFYVGIHHANNIGRQFRPDNPLLPNYKYVPIGYHGRASSIRVSGEIVIRPSGQRKPPNAETPDYGPSRRLDYELELGVWIAGENSLGETVPIAEAPDRIAGLCLLNDWSARDLQAWEYQPLGPFLAKNFLSTISPWVITSDALAPFHIAQAARPEGDPAPLPYLWDKADQAEGAFSIRLEAFIITSRMRSEGRAAHRLSTGPASNMYWTVAQMIAHHAANGCNLMPGDLLGTGTISGPEIGSFGSLIETSNGGNAPVELPTGETRSFLEDGDELVLKAAAEREGFRSIGFGPCRGIVKG